MQPNRTSRSTTQRLTSGQSSRMQAPLATHRVDPQAAATSNAPSQTHVARPNDEPARSVWSSRPSQMQVAIPGQVYTEQPSTRTTRFDEGRVTSRQQAALASINEAEPSYYGRISRQPQPSSYAPASTYAQPSRSAQSSYNNPPAGYAIEDTPPSNASLATPRATAPTFVGKSIIVRPGDPHHFGMSASRATGEIICTLCRCRTPGLHGDAYTMLKSPRGKDIHGKPIDWQEAKRRMLDYYRRNQISHAEEIAAIPFIFDKETAKFMMDHEQQNVESARRGDHIIVNDTENNTNWLNEDGHSKKYITEDGAKTRIDRRF